MCHNCSDSPNDFFHLSSPVLLSVERRGHLVILHLFKSTPINSELPKQVWGKACESLSLGGGGNHHGWRWLCGYLLRVSNASPTMAVDDSNLYSRTKNKLHSAQNDYKSSRRSSLPPELLLGHDIRGRLQRNIKNLEPIHLRRPKKRPSIFPGRNCLNVCLLVENKTKTAFHLLQ